MEEYDERDAALLLNQGDTRAKLLEKLHEKSAKRTLIEWVAHDEIRVLSHEREMAYMAVFSYFVQKTTETFEPVVVIRAKKFVEKIFSLWPQRELNREHKP